MDKIRYSRLANQDLREIGDYIAEELKNPVAAQNTVDKIQNAIDRLSEHPQSGAPLSSRYEDPHNYRYVVSGNYLAFYRVVDDTVLIDRILYGRRDYLYLLFAEIPGNK